MVGQRKPDSIGQRHPIYIDELREFFASRDVAFGDRNALQPFVELLAQDAFAEEMGSLIRSILYQEDRLDRGELVRIVISAVAGFDAEEGGAEYQKLTRTVFQFVNDAVRETQFPMQGLDDLPEAEQDGAVPSETLPSSSSEQLLPAGVGGAHFAEPRIRDTSPPASATGRGDVLYRAMALSADEVTQLPSPSVGTLNRGRAGVGKLRHWWVIPVFGVALAALLAGVYVLGPRVMHGRLDQISSSPAVASEVRPIQRNACAAPIAAGVTRSGLEERSLWAHNLLSQGLYEAAVPELREIARLDPGFPGVRLDESDALLHLKRPEEAREAIDAQISMSECLNNLPPPALMAYCSAQYAAPALAGCRLQVTHIRQAAELQAALVHLELGHRVQPDAGAAAALAELSQEEKAPAKPQSVSKPIERPKRAEPLPPATEGDTAQPPLARDDTSPPTGNKASRDKSLVRGEGTDSAYGAYQKPQ